MLNTMANGVRNSNPSGGPPVTPISIFYSSDPANSNANVDTDADEVLRPKRNKKIVRIVTVLGYIFAVSMIAILLSLYYLFLWDPYMKASKSGSRQLTVATTTHSTTPAFTLVPNVFTISGSGEHSSPESPRLAALQQLQLLQQAFPPPPDIGSRNLLSRKHQIESAASLLAELRHHHKRNHHV